MRFLNGFILIGIALFFISLGGLVTGNRMLTEPGQAVNPYSWLLYLAASVLMLINGGVSIWNMQQHEKENPKQPDTKPDSGASDDAAAQP